MYLATVSTVPWAFQILGIVTAEHKKIMAGAGLPQLMGELAKEGQRMNAKAVIGIQVASHVSAVGGPVIYALGTAITW